MKHILILFLLTGATTILMAQANTVDIGIFNQPVGSNTFEVRIKPTQNLAGNFSASTFTVRFPSSYGVTLSMVSTPYNFSIQPLSSGTLAGYDYYAFTTTTLYPVTWVNAQEYILATFQHSGMGNGTGVFELITNGAWTNTHNCNYYIELNGGDAQNSFYSSQASAPLPVELSDFQAKLLSNRTVALDWECKSEHDLAHYAIEYSMDGVKFGDVGAIPAKNILQQEVKYSFTHIKPHSGDNYYRLRMVDRNGSFEYSLVRTITLEDDQKNFSLIPTPTTGPLTLLSTHIDQYPDGLKYRLMDSGGKILQANAILSEKTDFNLSVYAAGIYYLTIHTNQEQVKQFRVIVTKN